MISRDSLADSIPVSCWLPPPSLFGEEVTFNSIVGSIQVELHDLDIPVVEQLLKLSGIGLHLFFLARKFVCGISLEKVNHADEVACLLGKSLVEIGFLLQVFVLIDIVEDEARCWSTSSLLTTSCIAHEFSQIRLEDLLLLFIVEFFLLLLNVQEIATLCLWSIWTKMLDSKSIKAEHPLVHLEFFDVELAHELDNFDSLKR